MLNWVCDYFDLYDVGYFLYYIYVYWFVYWECFEGILGWVSYFNLLMNKYGRYF